MIELTLFFEFFKIGLFAVGGGLATVPFLFDLGNNFGWFTADELVTMIAISESTPGPLGVNMATYTGFRTLGLLGGVIATLGLVTPALFVIIAVSKFLKKFKEAKSVQAVFYGLRPAVGGMILFFIAQIGMLIFQSTDSGKPMLISVVLFLCYLFLILRYKLHPIFFICLGAVMGVLVGL